MARQSHMAPQRGTANCVHGTYQHALGGERGLRSEQDGFSTRCSPTHLRRLRAGTIEFRLEILYHVAHLSHLILRRVLCLPVSSVDLGLGGTGPQ